MSSPRLEQLLSFLEKSPKEPFIQFAVAKEYEGLGDSDQALAYYLRLSQEHSSYVGTYYHLGKLYETRGAYKEAFETYKKGMQVAKEQADQHSYSELAGAKLNIGDDDDFE